jgi:hypothetical protein
MAKEKAPPAEGKQPAKEHRVDLREFIQSTGVPELLQIVRQTALATHPLVRDFDQSQDPLKEQTLRRLVHREQKNHADFRNRLTFLLARR